MNAFKSTADINKEAILEIARNGGPRPGRKTKLGVALMRYTRKSHPNGTVFLHELQALRADWFRHVARNKETILEIARNGGPRPRQKTKLGIALSNYTSPSQCSFAQAFLDEITALRPEWFLDTVAINKAEILEIARDGEPRPSEKTELDVGFSDYIKNCGGSFDQVVHVGLKAIRPEWFKK